MQLVSKAPRVLHTVKGFHRGEGAAPRAPLLRGEADEPPPFIPNAGTLYLMKWGMGRAGTPTGGGRIRASDFMIPR